MIFGIKILRLDFLFLLYQDKRKDCLQIKKSNNNNLSSTRPYTFKDYIPDIILLLGIYNRKNTPLPPLKRGIRERFLFEGTFIFLTELSNFAHINKLH